MTRSGDFISLGLHEAGEAVTDVVAMANLHLGPKRLSRRLAQRASGRLKLVETIVRRLVLLLALSLRLAPVRKRPAPGPDTAQSTATAQDALPDGVEIALFPRLRPRRLALLPRPQRFEETGPFMVQFQPGIRPAGPVSPVRLMARIAALQRVLAAPDAYAKRLARSLHRLKASGEPRPAIGSAAGAHRLRPELGALSTMLPGLLGAALETWETSP